MKILVSGSHGVLGSALLPVLRRSGATGISLLRSTGGKESGVQWDPAKGIVDRAGLEGFDAVVHLAGENLASGRWTSARKARIRESRIAGTRLISEALGGLSRPPATLLSASAIGYYGSRGDELLDEQSPPGTGFLAELCREWEAATAVAASAGIRVAHLRFGMVLSPAGGALAKMLPPFRWALGGPMGAGEQYWSWITLGDAVAAVGFVLRTQALAGPVNVVAPGTVRN